MISDLVIAALQFYREPRRFAHLTAPDGNLPAGLTELLAAPGNELSEESIGETARALGASEQECREIVPFFIKQVLLVSGADYHRILGVRPDAELSEIRLHHQYLMRLFHPDRDASGEGWDDVYAPRINEAYSFLRNSQKRRDYDESLAQHVGFKPTDLKAEAASSPLYRPSPAESVTHSSGLSPRARWLAGGAICVVLVVFLLIVSMQSRQPTLKVSANPNLLTESADECTEAGFKYQ